MNDKRKLVYDKLVSSTGYKDSFEEFNQLFDASDENKRKVYDALGKTGYKDSFEEFVGLMQVQPSKQDDVSVQAPAPAVPENPAPFTMDAKVRDYVLANKPSWLKPQPLATAPLGPDYTPLEDTEKRFEVAEKVRPYMIKEQNKGALRTLESDLSALRSDLTAKMKAEKDDGWNLPTMRSDVGAALLRQTKAPKYESKEALQLQNVEYAEKLLGKSKRLLEEGENPSTSFIHGLRRGFSDSMSDLDKWTMGWSDLENNLRVQDIVRKIEKDQPLDASEQAVMDAMVTNAATEMLYREGLGRGYKAGEVAGESLPFMLDMIGSMGVIQSTTRPLSRAMMKYATSKLRQMGVKSGSLAMASGRGLAHLGSGATNLALHTATAGAPRVAADYAQRGIGQTEIDFKPSGNAVYKGQSGQESGASAFGKAVISTAAETGSELLGEKFMPLLGYIGRVTGVNKIGSLIPKRIGELASDIASNPAVKEVMGFAKAAKISDPISEYAEEVVNNLVSVGIGDMSIDQLTDLDQNIDTFLGVAPISVLFGGAGAGAYIRSKYKVNKEMKNFERKMSENYGEDWTEIRNALQNSTIEEARNFVKDILSRNDLSKAEKKDMVRYVYANMQEQTLSSSDVVIDPEEIEANKREIFNAYQVASKRVPFLTDEDKAKLPMMSVEEIESMDMPDDVKDRVIEYKAALEDYNRYIELTNARVQRAREQAIAQVEELTNYSTGTVMRVKSGFSDNPVHILRGKVTFNDKGEVDASKSDKVIYYMDEDGSVKMGSTSMIQELIDETDASALAEQAANDAQAEIEAQETAETSPVEVDTTIQSGDTSYYVQAKNPDGTYLVSVTTPQGEQIAQMTEQQLQDLITTQKAVQVDEMSQQTAESATTTQNVESTVQNRGADNMSNFEETLPRDDKGNFDFAAFTPEQAYQYTAKMSGEDVAREDLQADVNNLQAEIDKLTEQAKKAQGGKRIQIRQQIADKTAQLNSMTELLNSVTPAETIQEVTQEETQQDIAQAEVQAEVQAEPTAYEDMDSYDTLADLNKDLSEEEVDAFVANNIKEYESQLGKVKAPKIGTDKAAYIEEKKAVEAEKAEIQRKIDYWKGIQGELSEMRSQIGEKEAQEILSQDEPQTAEEYAALKLGGGAIKLNRESYLKETGYGNEEAKKMFGLFSKDGVSIERAGEMLEEEAKEDGYNFFAEGDVNAGRAAVLNVLSEARTRGDLINYIKNRRQAQAERQMNAERAYYEDMIERNFNMTAEEYEQYVEVAEREIGKRMLSDEDYNEFMGYFADENLKETEDGRKETDIERSEAGGEVLQGEQSDNAGGSTEVETEPTEVDGRGDNTGNVAPEEVELTPTQKDTSSQELSEQEKKGYKDMLKELEGKDLENFDFDGEIASRENQARQNSEAGKENIASYVKGIIRALKEVKERKPSSIQQAIQQAESEVNTEPTEAQKEAGNYKMGHIKIDGMDITIENPKGSTRSGVDANGKEWSVTMNNTYGYIRGTRGVDGDHIDIFLSDNPESGNVYVIDQVDQQTGMYDESKVMYGFGSMEEARDAYLSNYEEGWKVGVITEVSKEEFKKWLDSSTNKIKPFSEYVGIEKGQTEDDGAAKDIEPVNDGIQPKESVLDYAKRVAEREEKKKESSRKKKIDLRQFVDKSKEPYRNVLKGVFYNGGMATSSNGQIAVRVKADYPSEYEGKSINKDGTEIQGKYPNLDMVVPNKAVATFTIDLNSLKQQRDNLMDSLRQAWDVEEGKKGTFNKFIEDKGVVLRIGNLNRGMRVSVLNDLVDALEMTGVNELSIGGEILFNKSGNELLLVVAQEMLPATSRGDIILTDYQFTEAELGELNDFNVPITDMEGIPVSEDGRFQVYAMRGTNGNITYSVSSDGKTVRNKDKNYRDAGDAVYKSLEEAIAGAKKEREIWAKNNKFISEREAAARKERAEEERKAKEKAESTLGRFLATKPKLQAARADKGLSERVSFNGVSMPKASFIEEVIADGYKAEEYVDGATVKYRLVKDEKGYKINKTEFDFAKFAGAETIEVENKEDIINLEKLSKKYADKGVYTMSDIDNRIAAGERRLKGTNPNGKEGKEVSKMLEELKELKRLKEMRKNGELRFREEEPEIQELEDVRFREAPRTIVDSRTNELAKEFLGEDLSRYPYEDRRTNPDNEGEVWYGYSEPLYNGVNAMDSEEVPEQVKDIIRDDEYEIDRRNIVETLERNIEWEGGYEEESAKPIIDALEWFRDNQKNFRMSDKVNLIVDKPERRYLFREDDKNLVAVHNLSEESLKKAFELGGFPMPSIAVTSKDVGHTEFGDISLVFDKQTINPVNEQNRIYGGDAWTPTFPEIGIKIDERVAENMREKVNKLLEGKEYVRDFSLNIDNANLEDKINRSKSFREAYKSSEALKIAFLSDKGIAFKPVLIDKKYSSEVDNATLKDIVKATGKKASELMNLGFDETMKLEPTVREIVSAYRAKEIERLISSLTPEQREKSRALAFMKREANRELGFSDMNNLFYDAYQYERSGDRKVADRSQTIEKLNKKFTKKLQSEYEEWLDELSDGIIEKTGIRNERDMFTSSGNRRSWEALYDEVTIDNVVKAMKAQSEKGGEGVFGGSIFGAAQKEISSIDELKELAKRRIAEIDSKQYEEERDRISDRLSSIEIPGRGDGFGSTLDMIENITDAVKNSHTANGIYKYLKKYYPRVTKGIAEEIADIVKDIQNMSTRYFEAKPYRAVGFDEVKVAVVPKGTSKEVIDKLEQLGIPVKTYKKGDYEAMKRVVNTAAKKSDLLFRFIGEQGAANLDRTEEATTRLDNLNIAREMEGAGKDAKTIKMATGWERGADGKWRYETADAKKIDLSGNVRWLKRHPEYARRRELNKKANSAAILGTEPLTEAEQTEYDELKRSLPDVSLNETQINPDRMKLADIVDDDALFEAYPELADIDVKIVPMNDDTIASVVTTQDMFKNKKSELRINKDMYESGKDRGLLETTIEHEIQHLVQDAEGFARGGTSLDVARTRGIDTYALSSEEMQVLKDKYEFSKGLSDDITVEEAKERYNSAERGSVEKKVYAELYSSLSDGYSVQDVKEQIKEAYDRAFKALENDILNPESAYNDYLKIAGEVEARNVQSRLNMTPEQRRSTLASETEDVAREDQIFIYDSMGANSMSIDANDTATKLGVPITVHDALDSVPEGPAKEAINKGRKVKGWYDTKTGTVHVYMPNATSAEDIQKTILHEGVAHYGLRQLVGEQYFDDFLDEVFANVSQEVRGRIVSNLPKYGYNSRVATEEYMATLAENGVEPSVWNRIKQAFKELLRKVGIKVSISDNELKYILWRSAQNLRMNNPLDLAKDVAMQYNMGVGNYSPDTFFREDDAIEAYNQSFNKKAYWFKEAWQDSMLALKNLQDVVAESSGEPIKDFENAYMAENQLSRLNKAQSIKFWDEYMQPLANEVAKMVSKDVSYQDIIDYLMLSHGIERNVEMSNRERINDMDEQDREAAYEQFYNDVKALRRQYKGYDYLKALNDYFGEVDDYSATEAILSRDGNEHTDFQNEALERVREFEAKNDVAALRKLVKAATDQSLRKTFESGMMGRDEYNRVKDMFAYYVPLRGWEGTKAEDVYGYMGDMNPVNSTLKKMKGRNTIPDDPIATIGNMGESAIVQGNRNAMKQKFYNMAVNHPTDLITMTKAWYAPNANGDMELSLPQIDETDNAETIAQKIKDHDELMKSIGATRKKQGLNISYPITSSSKTQHAVIVKIGGKDYVLYVNGNPRAAQAVNGLTNPDAETNPALKATYWLNRTLSALYTSKNPEFVVSNFMRDYIEAGTVISAKENSDYNKAFRKNMRTALVDVAKGFKGKLKGDANKYFTEFTENGGQMGYFSISDVNAYKKKLKKQMDVITGRRGSARKALSYIGDAIEGVNKYAETVSRYAAYRTSREMGRSIEQSIKDASDVTVNFSKKGSGFKAMGGKIVKGDISAFVPKVAGLAAGSAKMLYLFINPAIQSLANWGYIAKRNKKAIMGIVGGFALAGYVMPIINQVLWSLFGDDDRENPYNDLPEWIRRNNICIGVGTYLTIPLPHTLRAFYGMGEMSYQVSTGKKEMSPEKMTYEVASQLTALLPIDPLGNEGDIKKTLTPSYLRGVAEAYIWNEDFMGTPIAKITPYNENDPEWKRVYKGTAGWLVDTSKFFNDLSAGKEAGRDFRKGVIDFNPAKMEHIGESYFGGIWKFLNNAGKTIYYTGESLIEGEKSDDLVLRNVPWVRRFLATSDERTSFSGLNERYYDLVDEMEQFKYELDGVKRSIKDDPEKYTWQYEELMKSDDYKKYKVYEGYRNALDNLYKISKSVSDEEKKQIEDYSNGLKRQLLEELK